MVGLCAGGSGGIFITVANGQMQGIGGLFAAALSFSALTVLVALGQMLVISAGPGNADLSIPSTIALSSAVSMLVMDGRDAMVLPGLLAAAGVGAVVGLLNFSLIRLLRIPLSSQPSQLADCHVMGYFLGPGTEDQATANFY